MPEPMSECPGCTAPIPTADNWTEVGFQCHRCGYNFTGTSAIPVPSPTEADLNSRLWQSEKRESQLRDRISLLRDALMAVRGITTNPRVLACVRRALAEDDRRAAT